MAHGTKINGTSYGITGGKCLVGGTAYDIKKGRTLVGGTGYDIAFETPLSEYAEGDIVYINENGSPVKFYVAKHDYESSLNGSGRTLVVRKDCYDIRSWNGRNVNTYDDSGLDGWFNSTYKNMLDAAIRSLIGTTKIRYTPGNGNWNVRTLNRAVFALSATELGQSPNYVNVEGFVLPIADTLKDVYLNGSVSDQWTRSPSTRNNNNAVYLSLYGNVGQSYCGATHGSRPVFTLPSNAVVSDGNLIL